MWHDYGVIFEVKSISNWIASHAYVPTAILLKDKIRVFVAFLDPNKIGRLGYVDVNLKNPEKVIDYSPEPLLCDSDGDMFDSAGVTPLCALREQDHIKLYYAGWKSITGTSERYTLFTGLAIGDENANRFVRYSNRPIINGREKNENIRTAGQVLKIDNNYFSFVATQKGQREIKGKSVPIYDLEYATSYDGKVWGNEQTRVFSHEIGKILGYGRSAIWKNKHNVFEGLFSVRGWDGGYTDLVYSTSPDGISWAPLENSHRSFLAKDTCDLQSEVAFPSVISLNNRLYMFYNGDGFGEEGLRLAEWVS